MILTRELAWAASTDAGNASMKRGGRTAWSVEDYNESVRVFDELWPPEKDGWPPRYGDEVARQWHEAAEQEN